MSSTSPASSPSSPGAGANTFPFGPGTQVADRYRIERELARGGMGAVFVAWDEKFSQRVALKVSEGGGAQAEQFRARFRREAEIGNRLGRVEGFVRALDWGTVPGTAWFYLAMDLVEGARPLDLSSGSVTDRLRRLRRAVRLVGMAHKHHVVHRDLKPANFLQASDGSVHLTDFGLAKVVGDESADVTRPPSSNELTQSGMGMGTPLYMPPEQFEDAVTADSRADVYALGVMLFFALTGRHPYPGGTFQAVWIAQQKVQDGRVPPPSPRKLDPSVSEALDALCARAIALDVEKRLDDADELLASLDAAVGPTLRLAPPEDLGDADRDGVTPSEARTRARRPSTANPLVDPDVTTRGLAPTVAPSGRPGPGARSPLGSRALIVAVVVGLLFGGWVVRRARRQNLPPAVVTHTQPPPLTEASPPPTEPRPATEPTTAVTEPTPPTTAVTEPTPPTTTDIVSTTEPRTVTEVATTLDPPTPTPTPTPTPALPLALSVTSPAEVSLVTSSARVHVRGRIERWAEHTDRPPLLLDGSPVPVGADGAFGIVRDLADGEHVLELTLGAAREVRTIFVDTLPPALRAEAATQARTLAPRTHVRGAAAGAVSLTVGGDSVPLGADGAFDVGLSLAPGVNEVTVEARDSVGNAATSKVVVTRAPWARLALLASSPGRSDVRPLTKGARVPRGTRYKVTARPGVRASMWVLEVRGSQVITRRPPGRRLLPAGIDLIVPNRRDEWIVLDTPGEVELVVALAIAPPAAVSPEAEAAALLAALPPAGREAPGVKLEGDDQEAFLLMGEDGLPAEHPLTSLWLDEGAGGLTWRVRLIVE